MKTRILSLLTVLTNLFVFSQSQFQNVGTSSPGNAERITNFSVTDANNELLEITNSTNIDGQFIPSLWAHHQADNRYVFRHFITTNSAQDNGNSPMMIYRAEIRNNLNLTAGPSGNFPWGTTATNVINRPLFAWENGNTQLMRMLANGYLGIGTTTPTSLFHTNGTVRLENIATTTSNTYVLTTDANGNVSRQLSTSFGGGLTNSCANTNFLLKKSATDLTCSQIFDNGTNVGIGTATPTSLFHINGTVRFENLTDATNPFRILGTDNAGNVFEYNPSTLIGGGTNDYDWFRPDNTFANSISDNIYTNGKVGINTSIFPSQVGDVDVSSYSLFAKGGILTEEVRVALSSDWADFVFDKEYKLEPLKNVETFIKKNKHLKYIPSAQEVKKDGIELGEMNKLLLLKVEELTLYLIELNKKVEKQDEEIKKLKSK